MGFFDIGGSNVIPVSALKAVTDYQKRLKGASEHSNQVSLFQWANLSSAKRPELKLLFAIPNGGKRDQVTGAKLKAEGTKAGVPDICLPVARKGYHGMFIELKADKGRVSDKQSTWLHDLADQGYLCSVCFGWESAKQAIESYLG